MNALQSFDELRRVSERDEPQTEARRAAPLPTLPLPSILRNWRAVALSCEAAAAEWHAFGSPAAEGTLFSLRVQLRGLGLHPPLMLQALHLEYQTTPSAELLPSSRYQLLGVELSRLIGALVGGQALSSSQLAALGVERGGGERARGGRALAGSIALDAAIAADADVFAGAWEGSAEVAAGQ